MAVGLALFTLTLVLRGASANRHMRGRLVASSGAFGIYAVLAATLAYRPLSSDLLHQIQSVEPLLIAFGVINAVVALLINPWRIDRLPDRFPNIVQDTIVITLFAVAATAILQERVFAMTAAGAVVVGFALQDTLGNLFAGLAIQIEKPFRVGHWVHIGDTDGLVSEVTWRATKIRTKAGNFVIVPNSKVSDGTIINYSEPSTETRIDVEVGASYDTPPNDVKATILAAVKGDPKIASVREPEVLVVDFAASSITYRVRVWTTDFAADERLRDRIRSAIYYAFRRQAIEIPYPIQVAIPRNAPGRSGEAEAVVTALGAVSIFQPLSDDARGELASATRRALYAEGEVIVRQDEAGSSMFVVDRGEAVVALEPSGQEIARLGPGEFFGEMSLLTGAVRSATVRAAVDSDLLEITGDAFRRFVLANPAAVDAMGLAVSRRASELIQHRAAGAVATPLEPPQTFLIRVRRFLGLSAV
jgi:small-conductance mechanosensitive channel/CRP-like cAMP-binding protein